MTAAYVSRAALTAAAVLTPDSPTLPAEPPACAWHVPCLRAAADDWHCLCIKHRNELLGVTP